MNQEKRLHFGVLISSVDNACQCKIWDGIVDYAHKNDIHLTAYLGTYQLKDDTNILHYETCFDAIENAKLDGLIVFSGFIAEDIGLEKFNDYVKKLPKTLPLVSVSFPMEGVASVLVDNEKGIYYVVDHLIKNHGKKKIVFVKGPDGHPEAEARLSGYKKAIEDNGIEVDERYIFEGHFSKKSGQKAILDLLEKVKIPFDAVAACDDETAIGVLETLDERKMLVPADVTVTGFDDDLMSETYIPSLSTARQPFFEIGSISAETLDRQISGKKIDEINLVSPVFVPRQSCGCLEESVLHCLPEKSETAILSAVLSDSSQFTSNNNTIYSVVSQKFAGLFQENVPPAKVRLWVRYFVEGVKKYPFIKKDFIHLLDGILISYRHYSQDFSVWYEAIGALFEGIELSKNEIANVSAVFSALNSASILIYNISSKKGKSRELVLNDIQQAIRKTANALVLTFNIESLNENLLESLPELSLETVIIGLYKKPILSNCDKAEGRSIDRIIGFDKDKSINIKQSSEKIISLSDYSTVAGFNFEQELRTMIFIPLFFSDEEFGVIILPYNYVNPIDVYETLRISISTAVKGAELLGKVQTLFPEK
jgi:DNA-binding LacI/PurR family transcriptional regulator